MAVFGGGFLRKAPSCREEEPHPNLTCAGLRVDLDLAWNDRKVGQGAIAIWRC